MHLHGTCISSALPTPFKQMSKNTRSSVVGRFRAAVQLRAFHPLLHTTSSKDVLRTRRPPCTHKLSQRRNGTVSLNTLKLKLLNTIFLKQCPHRDSFCTGFQSLEVLFRGELLRQRNAFLPAIFLHGHGETSPYTSGSHDGKGHNLFPAITGVYTFFWKTL